MGRYSVFLQLYLYVLNFFNIGSGGAEPDLPFWKSLLSIVRHGQEAFSFRQCFRRIGHQSRLKHFYIPETFIILLQACRLSRILSNSVLKFKAGNGVISLDLPAGGGRYPFFFVKFQTKKTPEFYKSAALSYSMVWFQWSFLEAGYLIFIYFFVLISPYGEAAPAQWRSF